MCVENAPCAAPGSRPGDGLGGALAVIDGWVEAAEELEAGVLAGEVQVACEIRRGPVPVG